jgi:hypothetical protein
LTFSVFGYGSLVNRETLPEHVRARPATVRGWRRAWRAASRSASWGVCAVSVAEAPGAEIDGLLVIFEDAVWPVIEAREHRYRWFVLPDFGERVLAFRAGAEADRWGDREHPVHLTYVDTVLQGYLREFGEAGARRFMETTDGWHVPILDDRAAPRYPRARPLPAPERALVDGLLAETGATIVAPDAAPRG